MHSRRELFRGVSLGAGGLFFAPFIRQLDAQSPGFQQNVRVVFFIQGNGMYPDQIQPEGIEWPAEPDLLEDRGLSGHRFSRSVAPLEPFADRMCFLHGLSGRIALGNHGMGMGALGCYPSQKNVFSETIDSAIARSLPGLFNHVGLGVTSWPTDSIVYNVSAAGKGKPLPTQCNPLLAHKALFSLASGGGVQREFDAKTKLLDFLADDVRRMQMRLNHFEKERLDHYLGALESINDRRSALIKLADRISLAAPEADERYGRDTFALDRLEAQFEIAAGALIAGLTNVVTISSGAGRDQTGVDLDGTELGLAAGAIPAHEVGHHQFVRGVDPVQLHILTRQRHCEKLARLVRKLDSIPEGDGSMMDNTLIVYLSDGAEEHHPKARQWPILLIGDLGGRLRLKDRYLRFPWYGKTGHRTLASLFTSILRAVGDRRTGFGLPDPVIEDLDQSGPLVEVLV